MRVFLTVLILIFSLQSWTKADDIRDFEIEEMSIGDSLLDYFSEEEMIFPDFGYKDNTYKGIVVKSSQYEFIQIHVKSDDKKYIIKSIDGIISFHNNIEGCIKKKNEIIEEMLNLFKNLKKFEKDDVPMASGHGKFYMVRFIDKSGNFTEVTCYEYNDSWNAEDHLRIGITLIGVENWIVNKAFK